MSLVDSSLNGQSHRPLSTEQYVVPDGWGWLVEKKKASFYLMKYYWKAAVNRPQQ